MLRAIAFLSLLYDVSIGLGLLVAAPTMAALFGSPPVSPPVFGDVAGLLLVGIGLGYVLPLRDPARWRGYLWIMGPLLKGGGAIVFVRDALFRHSPPAFLLFALTDGTLAVLTFLALWRDRSAQTPATPGTGA